MKLDDFSFELNNLVLHMTSVPSSVSNCILCLGLDCGADLGPVGVDLEGPGWKMW